MKIVESSLAVKVTPVRRHKMRRWMSRTYHERIQKKWIKRFGYAKEACAYIVNPASIGMPGGRYIIAHPSLAARLRAELARLPAQEHRGFAPSFGMTY